MRDKTEKLMKELRERDERKLIGMVIFLLIILTALLLSACQANKEEGSPYGNKPVEYDYYGLGKSLDCEYDFCGEEVEKVQGENR